MERQGRAAKGGRRREGSETQEEEGHQRRHAGEGGAGAGTKGTSLRQGPAQPGKKHEGSLGGPHRPTLPVKWGEQSAGHRRQFHNSVARLSCEQQGREATLGDY